MVMTMDEPVSPPQQSSSAESGITAQTAESPLVVDAATSQHALPRATTTTTSANCSPPKSPKSPKSRARIAASLSPTHSAGRSIAPRSGGAKTPSSSQPNGANGGNTATGPLAHTLCTRLLTDGHVAAFSQAFNLLGLGLGHSSTTDPSSTSSSSSFVSASTASPTESTTPLNTPTSTFPTQHRLNQARLTASPVHVQWLCTLLTAVEDARSRLPPAAPFSATPALWHATRALAVFLTDVLPDAAVEYAKQALQVAQKLADPCPTPPAGAMPNTPGGTKGPATTSPAAIMSPEEAKQVVIEGHVLVGNACAQLGQWPAAMVEYRLALSVPDAVERLVYSAMQYAGTQEHSASTLPNAIRIYKDTLLCIPPLHPRATMLEMKLRRRLGLAYMSQGDLTAAEVQLTQFLTWTQSHPRPTFSTAGAEWPEDPVGSVSLALAECRELAGDLEGAVLVLTEYMNVNPAGAAGGPVREKVAVVLGNLLNRLNRGGSVTKLLAESQGDAAACQLGIARGMELFDDFLKSVNKSPKDMFRFMDEVREKYAGGGKAANPAAI